jgi:hypothetical protein
MSLSPSPLAGCKKLKKRYDVKTFALHGEASDANPKGIKLAQMELGKLLDPFKPEDVCNQNETGMVWHLAPENCHRARLQQASVCGAFR